MKNKNLEREHKNCHRRKPSSFSMQNPDDVFNFINLKVGDIFIDLGCGKGDYSVVASSIVESKGKVHALDCTSDLIEELKEDFKSKNLNNVFLQLVDITKALPFDDNYADVCFVATVLHGIPKEKLDDVANEVHRVLRKNGRFIVMECSKKDFSIGPPEYMRLTENEVSKVMIRNGFTLEAKKDLGFNYLISFIK